MNLKRLALRCATILIIVVALCMFFGQTVLTLTTPKVVLVEAQNGRLEDRIPVTAELYFDKGESFTPDAKDVPVMVDKVYVTTGDELKAGDILFTAKLQSEYDDAYDKQFAALQKEQKELLKLEMNKASTKNTSKNDAEAAYYEAQDLFIDQMTKLVDIAAAYSVELTDDVAEWPALLAPIMTPDLQILLDKMAELKDQEQKAKTKFMKIHKKGTVKDDSYEYIKKRREAKKKIQQEQDKLVALVEKGAALKTVRAPRDGVVVKMDVKEGDIYKAEKPAYQLSVAAPLLRADISAVRKVVARDMRVEYKSEYETIRTSVTEVKRDGSKKYAAIELNEELLSALGGIRGLAQEPIELFIVYRSKGNATLIPAGAVRTEGDNAYVYVAEQRYSMWGEQMVARKMNVRVLEESDRMRAVDEDLRYQKIITQENAGFKEGDRVMEYIQ